MYNIRGLLFIFRKLAVLVLSDENWHSHRKVYHFWRYIFYSDFKIWFRPKMDLTRANFYATIFLNFRPELSQQQCASMFSIRFLAMTHNRKPLYIADLQNSIMVVVRLRTNFVKVAWALVWSAYKILHENLAVIKICSRWISHSLTIAQKNVHVDWCCGSKNIYNL